MAKFWIRTGFFPVLMIIFGEPLGYQTPHRCERTAGYVYSQLLAEPSRRRQKSNACLKGRELMGWDRLRLIIESAYHQLYPYLPVYSRTMTVGIFGRALIQCQLVWALCYDDHSNVSCNNSCINWLAPASSVRATLATFSMERRDGLAGLASSLY